MSVDSAKMLLGEDPCGCNPTLDHLRISPSRHVARTTLDSRTAASRTCRVAAAHSSHRHFFLRWHESRVTVGWHPDCGARNLDARGRPQIPSCNCSLGGGFGANGTNTNS